MFEHEGEGCDLRCHQTAEQIARRYMDNLQNLMLNAEGITLRVYYEATFAQEDR